MKPFDAPDVSKPECKTRDKGQSPAKYYRAFLLNPSTELLAALLTTIRQRSESQTAGGADKTDQLNTQTHRKQDYLAPVAKLSRELFPAGSAPDS